MIRPLDMQIMVQKTPEVAKPAMVENQHPQVQQQAMTEKFTKETLLNEERVIQTDRSESENVNPDGKGGAEYRRDKNKRQRQGASREEERKNAGPENGNQFDFSI